MGESRFECRCGQSDTKVRHNYCISNTFSQYNIEKKVDSDEEDEDEDEDGFGPKKAAVDEDDPVARELL